MRHWILHTIAFSEINIPTQEECRYQHRRRRSPWDSRGCHKDRHSQGRERWCIAVPAPWRTLLVNDDCGDCSVGYGSLAWAVTEGCGRNVNFVFRCDWFKEGGNESNDRLWVYLIRCTIMKHDLHFEFWFVQYPTVLNTMIIYMNTVAGKFKLSGADNPGIMHKFTSVLARNNLTIGKMTTSHEEAPFGGTELFTSKFLLLWFTVVSWLQRNTQTHIPRLIFCLIKWKGQQSHTSLWRLILIGRRSETK